MGVEIERKFLVRDDSWRALAVSRTFFRQGYMRNEEHATVRVRLAEGGAYLTLKAPRSGSDVERLEFNYDIPAEDARILLDRFCGKPQIEKYRYLVPAGNGLTWEVDEFLGENAGLIVAELELPAADCPYERPEWLGDEVTGDARYYNAMLAACPYSHWGKAVGTR